MVSKKVGFSKTRILFVFGALFACGAFVGVGIANWGHAVKNKSVQEPVVEQINGDDTAQGDGAVASAIRAFVEREKNKPANNDDAETLTTCQAVEKVLMQRLNNNDGHCGDDSSDLETLQKLVNYGCSENRDKFMQMLNNKQAILDVACVGYVSDNWGVFRNIETTCGKIEESLKARMPVAYADSGADEHIDRAKIYAIMSERGCPENAEKYIEMARQELEIARAIRDDNFNEPDTIEVVETYKRLKMQRDAQEVFDKVKKLTNPAIDFIMQVEKIINE